MKKFFLISLLLTTASAFTAQTSVRLGTDDGKPTYFIRNKDFPTLRDEVHDLRTEIKIPEKNMGIVPGITWRAGTETFVLPADIPFENGVTYYAAYPQLNWGNVGMVAFQVTYNPQGEFKVQEISWNKGDTKPLLGESLNYVSDVSAPAADMANKQLMLYRNYARNPFNADKLFKIVDKK